MGGGDSSQLDLLNTGHRALAQATSVWEIIQIRDQAEALRKLGRQAALRLEIVNRATELKISAERRAGALLVAMCLRGGDRRSPKRSDRLRLRDLGVSQNQSTRWQALARVPESVFRECVKQAIQSKTELTSGRLLAMSRKSTNGLAVERDPEVRDRIARGASLVVLETRMGGKQAAAATPANPASMALGDLANHVRQLQSVLEHYCGSGVAPIASAEMRAMKYLLGEIGATLNGLGADVGSCRCGSNYRCGQSTGAKSA